MGPSPSAALMRCSVIMTILVSIASSTLLPLAVGADAAVGLSFIALVNSSNSSGINSSFSCSLSSAMAFFNIPDTRVEVTVMTPARSDHYSIYCNLQFSFKDDADTCNSDISGGCPEIIVKNGEGVVVSRNLGVSPTPTLNTLFSDLRPADLDALGLLQIRRSDVTPNGNPNAASANLTVASAFMVKPPPETMGVGYAGSVRLQLHPDTIWGSISTAGMSPDTTTALLVCQAAFPSKTFYTAAFFSGAGFDTGFIAASGLYSVETTSASTTTTNSATASSRLQVQYTNTLTSSNYPGYLPTHETDLGVICGNDSFRLASNASAPSAGEGRSSYKDVNITYTCQNPSLYSCPKVATFITQRAMGLIPTTSYLIVVENATHSIFKIIAGGGGFTKMDLNGILQSLAPFTNRTFSPNYVVALGGTSGSASHNEEEESQPSPFLTPTTVIIMIAAGVMLVLAVALLLVPLLRRRSRSKPLKHYRDNEMLMMPAPALMMCPLTPSSSSPQHAKQCLQDDVEL